MNDTLEALIEKLAPVRRGVDDVEHYTAQGLLRRLGVDAEDLQELLESGTLCPCGKGRRKDMTGKDEVYSFRSDDLNALRRALVLEALKSLAREHEPEDSPEGERAFCRAAEFVFATERREPKSRKPAALHFAQDALRRARLVELDEPVLRGKLAADRYRKKIQDEDLNRRDANLGRAAAAGALAGAALRGKLKLGLIKRAAIGAGAGAAGVVAVRRVTETSKDLYGERSRTAKQVEGVPAMAAIGVAGYAASRRIRRIGRFFENDSTRREFAIADSAIGLLQRIGAKLAGQSRRRLIGGAAALGGTLGGLKAATDDDVETGVRGQTLAGGLKGAAIGTAGVIGAPLAYGAAKGIAARMRGLRPGLLRGLL